MPYVSDKEINIRIYSFFIYKKGGRLNKHGLERDVKDLMSVISL